MVDISNFSRRLNCHASKIDPWRYDLGFGTIQNDRCPVFDSYDYINSLQGKLNLSWTKYSSMHENISYEMDDDFHFGPVVEPGLPGNLILSDTRIWMYFI